MYVILEFCAEMTLQSYPALWSPHYYRQGAFPSAQNSRILVRNQNGRDYFSLVQPGCLGPPSKVVHFDQSSYLGRSD